MVERLPAVVAKGVDKIEIEDLVSVRRLKVDQRWQASLVRGKEGAGKGRGQAIPSAGEESQESVAPSLLEENGEESGASHLWSRVDAKQRAEFKAECSRTFRIVVRFALKAPRCYYCGVKLTSIALHGKKPGVESEEELAHLATNASLEAIVPRHAGGRYDEDNATLSCTPCNLLKMGWPADNFKVFLSELVKAQRTVDNLLVAQRPPTTRPLDQGEIHDVKDLLRLRRDGIIAGHKAGSRAECKLKTDEMFDGVKAQCLPNGMYADGCGLALPLAVAHLDRIISSRQYEPGNIRLYSAGFNFAKRSFNTDLVPIIYLENLQENFDSSSVEGLLAAGVEPLVASTFFGGCKKKDWHRSSYIEVYQLLDFSSLFGVDDDDDDEEEEEEDDDDE